MKKFACAALSTALLASMLAACGSSASTTPAASSADTSSDTGASSIEAAASTGAAADGSLHVAMNTDIQTMDVHKTNNDYMVPLNIFDRLFEIKTNADGSTELEKSLVEDYTVSDDGLTYDFTLRSGVTFSDGTPLTATQFHAGTEAYNNNKHKTKATHLYFLLAIIHMNIKPIVTFKIPFIIISML